MTYLPTILTLAVIGVMTIIGGVLIYEDYKRAKERCENLPSRTWESEKDAAVRRRALRGKMPFEKMHIPLGALVGTLKTTIK